MRAGPRRADAPAERSRRAGPRRAPAGQSRQARLEAGPPPGPVGGRL